MKTIESLEELERKLAALEIEDEDTRKRVTCSLIGHSRIQSACLGYFYCGRCGDQVGDTLGSSYEGAKTAVVIGHKCPTCEENFKACTWKDTYLCPDPFAEEVDVATI